MRKPEAAAPATILVEVVLALAHEQRLERIRVPEGTSVEEAIARSGLCRRYPGVDVSEGNVGIFGTPVPLERPLQPGDRVEIYRPLRMDPREQRRLRAARQRGRSG